MARPNKRRRELNRLNDTRDSLTTIHATTDEDRVGLCGYEGYYEITKNGEIFSKRANRFIKHTFSAMSSNTFIEFSLHGKKVQFGIGQAIALSFLNEEQTNTIKKELPVTITDINQLSGNSLINALASKYEINSSAIFYILKNEILERSKP